MDLFKSLRDRAARDGAAGMVLAKAHANRMQRHQREEARAIAKTREQWIYALQVDETAAWMSLYETRPDVLRGLTTVLGLAALAKAHDDGNSEAPEVRVILGAVSAIEQTGNAGSVITTDLNRSLVAAARMAKEILGACSDAAIEHAARALRSTVGLRS